MNEDAEYVFTLKFQGFPAIIGRPPGIPESWFVNWSMMD